MYAIKSNKTADLSEALVYADIINRGWMVLTPSSRDSVYDFVVDLGDRFEKVQVKTITGKTIQTTNRGSSAGKETVSTGGKVRNSFSYADKEIDWLVGVVPDTKRIYYYPLSIYAQHDKININYVETQDFPINCGVKSKRSKQYQSKERNALF